MNINSNISGFLTSSGIPVKEGKSYLLSLYFNVVPSYVPELLVQKMNRTGIYSFDDKTKTIQWNHPLFDEQQTGFDWVKNYRKLFADVNKERKGTLPACVKRMKDFFAAFPEVRKEDVMVATEAYIKTVEFKIHLKTAHKFIYEGQGANKVSLLELWIENTQEERHDTSTRASRRNTMR